MNRIMHRYMDQVVQLATHSVPVREVLLQAFNMLVPPTALFRPRVLFRVLLNVLKRSSLRSTSHSHRALARWQTGNVSRKPFQRFSRQSKPEIKGTIS